MSQQDSKQSLSYRDAGVDIDAGNALIERIKPLTRSTLRPGVLGGLGGFGALFELPLDRYMNPVLVSGTDGVGTKLKLAMMLGQHDTIGIDLVAMCVNDLVVAGAEPLFFLDYYATGQLNIDTAADVIKGIAEGCKLAGCALTGGETAEMPGMYADEDYDLAGFCVGIVEKADIIDGSRVKSGDILLGLASSGPHSNGYSLIRKIIEVTEADLNVEFDGSTLGQRLLEPTRIYVKPLLQLAQQVNIHSLCHVTGGGLLENLPRVMPPHTRANINTSSWTRPAVFDWLQNQAKIEATEMYRTFNCGIGMIIVIDALDKEKTINVLEQMGETVFQLGIIESSEHSEPDVIIN